MDYSAFNEYVRSLDELRNARLKLNRISITADLIKQRSTRPGIRFADLQQADTLLLLRAHAPGGGGGYGWFPRTLIYSHREGPFELFARAVSTKGMGNLLTMLGLKQPKDFFALYESDSLRQVMSHRHFVHPGVHLPPMLNLAELQRVWSPESGKS